MSSRSTVMTEMLLLLFRVLIISLLSPRIFISFLSSLRGARKIDLPLSLFSLVNTFFTSLFSDSTLLVEETKTVVHVEVILGEEKSYPKLVRSEADF